MGKIIELKNNGCFSDITCENILEGLLANGYVLNLTPCKYNEEKYTLMVEIDDVNESFIPEPTEMVNE